MSNLFDDDFTAELKKYFLENLKNEFSRLRDLIDEKLWKKVTFDLKEMLPVSVIDAQSNEYSFFATWLEQLRVEVSTIESAEVAKQALSHALSYLDSLLQGQKDSEELSKKYTLQISKVKSFVFLKCQVQEHDFAIPIESVIEITSKTAIYPLPQAEIGIFGIISFRGDPVPVLRLKDWELQDSVLENSVFIICEWNQVRFCLVVDRAEDLLTVNEGEYQSVPTTMLVANTIARKLVIVETQNVLLLDLDFLVAA